MQYQYFQSKNSQGHTPQEDWVAMQGDAMKLPVSMDFFQSNIKMVLYGMGAFFSIITFILYISMQLVKKLMKRMHRINTYVEIQSACLSFFAALLLYLAYSQINFTGQNASTVILDCMPWEYHKRYFIIAGLLTFLAMFSFVGAY